MNNSTPTYSDQSIVDMILQGGSKQEMAMSQLFRHFYAMAQSRGKHYQLEEEELLTAYGDALLALRRHILQATFRGDSSIHTWLYRTFSNKCVDVLRKRPSKQVETLEEIVEPEDDRQDLIRQLLTEEAFEQVVQHIEALGETCKKILLQAEYLGYSAAEIAIRIGFSNAHTVTSKKHKCLKRLKERMKLHHARSN